MSGGRFDYDQYKIGLIAESIEKEINDNEFSEEVIERFKLGIIYLKIAQVYAQRIDWFLSYDDSEETFFERLDEELKPLIISLRSTK
jgi:hypothetical protein